MLIAITNIDADSEIHRWITPNISGLYLSVCHVLTN